MFNGCLMPFLTILCFIYMMAVVEIGIPDVNHQPVVSNRLCQLYRVDLTMSRYCTRSFSGDGHA